MTSNAMVVIEESPSRPLSPAQRKYNATLAKIDKQKALLAEWQAANDACQKQISGKLEPLQQQMIQEQLQLAILLDNYLMSHKFNKKQKKNLTEIITQLCERLVEVSDDPQLSALCSHYLSPVEDLLSEDEQREIDALLVAEFEAAFGIQLDDSVDIHDPESMARYVYEQQEQQTKAHKKTARQRTKEAKEQAEVEAAQQSIQSIYRQLVKSLHPDREPDADARTRKTQLMQEVTVAYEQKNLIRLLELQRFDTQSHQALHELTDDKIKTFITLLEQQLQQIKAETASIQKHYKMMLGMLPSDNLTPKRLLSYLKEDIAHIKGKLQQIRKDRSIFEMDVEYLKIWLEYNC